MDKQTLQKLIHNINAGNYYGWEEMASKDHKIDFLEIRNIIKDFLECRIIEIEDK